MPDYGFRGKPVAEWSAADLKDFQNHLANDVLQRDVRAPSGRSSTKAHARSVFFSDSYAGLPGSPFAWHRDIKSRLGQAETVNQDLDLLKQCDAAGKLDGLSDAEKTAMFNGMASKMATVRYGYEAGMNPERAADYKTQMALTMEYGGIDMIQGDIDQWRSSMQELLNSEYDKSTKPNSRYVCRFFVRDDPAQNFDPTSGCVFYDPNLLDVYVQEYVSDRMAEGKPVKDMFRFTTAAGDYDLRYRVTKTAAVAQGARVMAKDEWINNSKAQAAFSNMVGWGFNGPKAAETDKQVAYSIAAEDGNSWLAASKARVERANKLYEDLEALSELPLDKHGSLKYQPSMAMCAKCGWMPAGSDKKTSPKEREAAFQRELFLRTADALYGPKIASKLQANLRLADKIPAAPGADKNELQQAWDEIRSGRFEALKDRVINWSGSRLEVIEAEDTLACEGADFLRHGKFHGVACSVRSDLGAVACMKDVFQEALFDKAFAGDGMVLPVEDKDLMYRVYEAGAEVRGEKVLPFEEWHAGIQAHPDWNVAAGEFVVEKPVIAKPEPVLPKHMRPAPEPVEAAPDVIEQDSFDGSSSGTDFDEQNLEVPPEVPVDVEESVPPEFAASGRDMTDVDAAAAALMTGDGGDMYEYDSYS